MHSPVLVLAGFELILFIAAPRVLNFEFAIKTVLITLMFNQVSAITEQCLQSIKALSISHSAPPLNNLGQTRS